MRRCPTGLHQQQRQRSIVQGRECLSYNHLPMADQEVMEVIPLDSGAYVPYQFTWPLEDVGQGDALVTLAMVIMRRHGGLLLGLPTGYLPHEVLQQASVTSEDTLFGPHTNFSVPAFREDAAPVPDGLELDVVVVDATDLVLDGLQPLSVDGVSLGFHDDIALVPSPHVLLGFAKEWLALQATQRATFYSAAEETVPETPLGEEEEEPKEATPQKVRASARAGGEKPKRVTTANLAEQIGAVSQLLPALALRLDAMQKEQEEMRSHLQSQQFVVPPRPSQQPVSTSLQDFAKMMGSPPRVKATASAPVALAKPALVPKMDSALTIQEQAEEASQPEGAAGSTLAQAVLEQSRALTTLVSQLQSGDPLLDSHQGASGTSLGSRGSAGRHQLQTELSGRSGHFFLQVTQNAIRRMRPSSRLPADVNAAAATDFSMVNYLERFGGYGGCREMGLVQFSLAHIYDAALHGDLDGVREHLALTMTAIEQAVQDNNRWDLAPCWRTRQANFGLTEVGGI